jgi:heme-degrading monooxygenase HmoA
MAQYLSISTEQPYLVLVVEYPVSFDTASGVADTLNDLYSVVPEKQPGFHGQVTLRGISGLAIFSISQWESLDHFMDTLKMPPVVPIIRRLRDLVTVPGKAFQVESVVVSPALSKSDLLSATSFVISPEMPCFTVSTIYECEVMVMNQIIDVVKDLHLSVARKMPGFRAGVVMSSVEFDRVMTVMQWESADDVERYIQSAEFNSRMRKLKGTTQPRAEAVEIARVTMPKFHA